MSLVDHFVVDDCNHKEDFANLCMISEKMDKDDFLDSLYFMREKVEPKMGKRPVPQNERDDDDTQGPQEVDLTAGVEGVQDIRSDHVDDLPVNDPPEVIRFPPIQGHQASGSSGSSAHVEVVSSLLSPQSQKRKAPVSRAIAPPKPEQWIIDLMQSQINANNRMREEQREENKRARQENKDMMREFLMTIPAIVSATITHMKPLMALEPLSKSPRLQIAGPGQALADSAKPAPTRTATTYSGPLEGQSRETQQEPESKPDQEPVPEPREEVEGERMDVDANPIPEDNVEEVPLEAPHSEGEEAEKSQDPVTGSSPG